MEHSNGNSRSRSDQSESIQLQSSGGSSKRKLYAIEEHEESSPVTVIEELEAETAYDADVDELEQPIQGPCTMISKLATEREIIYELFQPWALKTYGDQAKTKTITLRKKARILKALEGKEHSRPDSSKFRFWVKTKGFTTKRPDGFEETPGSRRRLQPLPNTAILSDNPGAVDLFAASASKEFGRRNYRKVACVEEFFDIIYNVHMELGGRSGMHAGQKRTYRIITETYAFLPREAVTRFLTICPECKKNLRPSSPSSGALGACKDADFAGNESSSEVENYLNYSSHTESSLETGPTAKRRRHSSADLKGSMPLAATSAPQLDVKSVALPDATTAPPSPTRVADAITTPVSVPKIRVKPQLQRPLSPPNPSQTELKEGATASPTPCFDIEMLKSRDNLLRYYDFMRRFYGGSGGSSMLSQPVLGPPLYGSSLLQSLTYPTTTTALSTATPTTSIQTATSNTQTHTKTPSTPLATTSKFLAPTPSPEPSSQGPMITLKSSPDSLTRARSPLVTLPATPTVAPSQPIKQISSLHQTPINLSKPLFSSSSKCQPASTSTPVPLKLELPSPPKPLPELRIPQLRGMPPVETPLPPLDLERLKPITSTYLQLTRSMGLSDEDALRFDNLVSKDFKYSL
ncbi:uncharacterized protein Dwil_GK15032 [Drosophila willistoni]|uniref:Integrase zinc-binding domain-containing protein n=1 Tax=Drosophila willistoni TaxID=7260 RepID=B4MVM5_DROWI|nr:uncharacterized protein Dwil_GK15032 [Drosophila willistoni]